MADPALGNEIAADSDALAATRVLADTDHPAFFGLPFDPQASASLQASAEELRLAHIKYRLTSLLQSSLDLEELLAVFTRELESLVPMDGFCYSNTERDISIRSGTQGVHRCCYRLLTESTNIGELSLLREQRFAEKELELIENVLSVLFFPLRNALKYRAAIIASLTDPMTGAGNRIALENSLRREMELARRHQSPFSLLVIDVDDFKSINDRYGHQTGDSVLKTLFQELTRVNRQTDLCYRFGGEEFVVLLNETGIEGAMIMAERIRESIASLKLPHEEGEIGFTASIGAAEMGPEDNKDKLFARADSALYQAKTQGKNRSVAN